MADFPEVRSDRLPAHLPAPGQLFGRPHTYGVAHDLERMRQGLEPPPRPSRVRSRSRPGRSRRGPWAALLGWWANSEHGPVDVWRRIRCRSGRHDIRGGHLMQLGSRSVLVERRCIHCDAEPPS